MNHRTTVAALACASLPLSALAHVVAGARVFPVTLTIDDPGVADEASAPAFAYSRAGAGGGPGPTHEFDFGFEYDKTITPETALIVNGGVHVLQTDHAGTVGGLQDLVITGKWQAITDAPHEFVLSLGLQQEIGGTGSHTIGADETGFTAPTAYFGKGMGDLPIGASRALAITGELSYAIADKGLKALPPLTQNNGLVAAQFNNGLANTWAGGVSLQYSIPYLQSQVKDVGLTGILGNLVPLVEFTWTSPASHPNAQSTTWNAAPGAVYMARWGEIGVEALIPLNRGAGANVGVVGLVHFFFDDLFPHSIGRPIFQ